MSNELVIESTSSLHWFGLGDANFDHVLGSKEPILFFAQPKTFSFPLICNAGSGVLCSGFQPCDADGGSISATQTRCEDSSQNKDGLRKAGIQHTLPIQILETAFARLNYLVALWRRINGHRQGTSWRSTTIPRFRSTVRQAEAYSIRLMKATTACRRLSCLPTLKYYYLYCSHSWQSSLLQCSRTQPHCMKRTVKTRKGKLNWKRSCTVPWSASFEYYFVEGFPRAQAFLPNTTVRNVFYSVAAVS